MNKSRITPEKVTRPIQLLAAWLTGLIIVNATFLATATQIDSPPWVSGVLAIASTLNVPLFLICIFILQTKFRPEMQEDSYYSEYLAYKSSSKPEIVEQPDIEAQVKKVTEDLIQKLGPELEDRRQPIEKVLQDSQVEQIAKRVDTSRTLSEIYKRPQLWSSVVREYREEPGFLYDINRLIKEGLLEMENGNYDSCRLTLLGERVARFAEQKSLLFYQQGKNEKLWNTERKDLERTRG